MYTHISVDCIGSGLLGDGSGLGDGCGLTESLRLVEDNVLLSSHDPWSFDFSTPYANTEINCRCTLTVKEI